MKKLIILIILIAVLIIVYKNFVSPSLDDSPEEMTEIDRLEMLEEEFESAKMQLFQAERSAGLTGVDTTSEAEMAINIVKRIKEKLTDLKDKMTNEEDLEKAEEFEEKIDEFLRKNG